MMCNHKIRILLFYPRLDIDVYPTYCFSQRDPCWSQCFVDRRPAAWRLRRLGSELTILGSPLIPAPGGRYRLGQDYDYPHRHLCYPRVNGPSFSGYTTR